MGMDCPYLAEAWKRAAGLIEEDRDMRLPSLQTLLVTEWSKTFEQAMRVRLVMGAFRYGRLGDPRKPTYDRTGSIERRLTIYRKTRNKELLVDIANLCLLEFVEAEGTFVAVDDGEHVQTI